MIEIKRKKDWKQLLDLYMNSCMKKAYKLGEHDCALFAANTILKITGYDSGVDFRGKYSTQLGYRRIFKTLEVNNLHDLADLKFGDCIPISKARPGDLVYYVDSIGIEHLGIALEEMVAITGKEGLHFIELEKCEFAWSV